MVFSPADQQGEKFPHSFLPGCSHGFLSSWSTGGKIPPFLSPSLLSWFPLLLINRGNYWPHFLLFALNSSPADKQGKIFPYSFLSCFSHGSLSCRSTGVTISLISYSLRWIPLLQINRGKYSPIFSPGPSHGWPSCWSTGVTIAFISNSLGWVLLLKINRGKYSPIPFSLAALLFTSPADQ